MPYYKAIGQFRRKNPKTGVIEDGERFHIGWGTKPGTVASTLMEHVYEYEILEGSVTVKVEGPFQSFQDVPK